MFSDTCLSEPKLIQDIENPPNLCEIDERDGIFFNPTFSSDRRIRTYTYRLLLQAQKALPPDCHFMVFEAYRPLALQLKKWQAIQEKLHAEHPDIPMDSPKFIDMCTRFIANPLTVGSGHQTGAAIDITLCTGTKELYDMESPLQGFSDLAETAASGLSETAQKNRALLKNTLEAVGFVNYPSEWWHYSFGDRLWAKLTGSTLAIFGKLDC